MLGKEFEMSEDIDSETRQGYLELANLMLEMSEVILKYDGLCDHLFNGESIWSVVDIDNSTEALKVELNFVPKEDTPIQ